VLNYDLDSNDAQREVVNHNSNDVLMIVAGPGSGKTAILILRALRHVLVDDILPEAILITTFTRKAAKELRTRWLDWGIILLNSLQNNPDLRDEISRIDLNRCRIDTLDSIAQQALTENKLPGKIAPVVLEGYGSKLILKRSSFSPIYYANKNELNGLFSRYTFDGQPPRNQGEALTVAKTLCDRLIQDRVNLNSYGQSSIVQQRMVDMLNEYLNELHQLNLFDFATLELELLNRLHTGTLEGWANGISALLIDEYQDTNPLQEAIYYGIISTASASPTVTIVGDDDQSMYRFRGGSVELFTQFESRCLSATGMSTRRIDMVSNYRSSSEIVQFYNTHISGDSHFAGARILPSKPDVVSVRGALGMPILGLFRDGKDALADALANCLQTLLTNRSMIVQDRNAEYEITLTEEGDLGDFVFLAHSIDEITYDRYSKNAQTRFPWYLRNAMSSCGLRIFNPRGMSLRTIESVQQLLGLLILCIDPNGERTNQVQPTNEARYFLSIWRNTALTFINQNPLPGGLHTFVNEWQRASQGQNTRFPSDWPVLELVYKLITWMPAFQNNPEHQVWLEAITRSISSAGMASPYGMQLYKADIHREPSRASFIRDALLPIAEDEVEVDEDIMPSVPRSWLQFMTIHQAKGLEFPMTIVDVGSRFSGNYAAQAFLRFPRNPSSNVIMEDDIEPHLGGPLRNGRTSIDRSFDDLIRLYYVAYSRPQSVLLLVGDEKCLTYGRGSKLTGAIPNMALGWNRDRTWPWRQSVTGRGTPVRVDAPLLLI
jgi:DNA helicase-2/ATP-dependent DNA helicase PcrA